MNTDIMFMEPTTIKLKKFTRIKLLQLYYKTEITQLEESFLIQPQMVKVHSNLKLLNLFSELTPSSQLPPSSSMLALSTQLTERDLILR